MWGALRFWGRVLEPFQTNKKKRKEKEKERKREGKERETGGGGWEVGGKRMVVKAPIK